MQKIPKSRDAKKTGEVASRGGKRPNAGRKTSPDKKIPFTIRIRRDLAAFLETQECKTAFVEAALLRTAEFKRWKASQ